ncbi:MAG TPA: Fe-S cluster assembly protein SufD [Blastocatellia bacterium]|nr:Fe-S cluster assembly protein SufD [Blastocatellia bacterium]
MLQTAKEKEMNHYLTAFAAAEPARANAPAWLTNLRANAIAQFERLGFPTTRHEEWKYTNVAPILKHEFRAATSAAPALALDGFTYPESRESQLVFVNGMFAPALSNLSALPSGVTVSNFAATDQKLLSQYVATQIDYHNDAFSALNTAFADDGALVVIPRGQVVAAPIHLLFVATEESVISHPRVLVVAEEGSIATLIESYVAPNDEAVYFTNAVAEIIVKADANLTHYRLQEESTSAFHIATTQVQQDSKSIYSSYAISLGGDIVRHTLNTKLDGEHIESTIDGLYIVTGNQHCDNHTTIDHAQPHCNSHQLYKGILDDKARAVFNGKIFVQAGALLTDARQLNKNLLLSANAHVDTKPQLEIYTDDVKCAHGATVGQLAEDELFYLRSRGLRTETARALLTYGFAEDVISKIKLESVRKQLDEIVLTRLHQNLDVK